MPRLKLFGGLRRHVTQYEFDVPGESIDEVLKELCQGNPSLYDAIFDGEHLRTHVRVMVAGRDVELENGLKTPVRESDEVAIFPPIAGG